VCQLQRLCDLCDLALARILEYYARLDVMAASEAPSGGGVDEGRDGPK